jgi:hypothetical protein
MKGDFNTLAWVNDKEGHEYVCVIDRKENVTDYEKLTDSERASCSNVNDFIGTDRW